MPRNPSGAGYSHENYEIICVNDGSKDGSLEILRQYERSHGNIRVIDQPNSGVSAARNAGMDAAKGEFIWFVDCDDFIQPNCLSELREAAQKVDILNFGFYSFRERLSQEEKSLLERKELPPTAFANHVCHKKSLQKRFSKTQSYAVRCGYCIL